MNGETWQKPWVRMLTTAAVAALMLIIFLFSTENAEESDHRSAFFSEPVIRILHPEFDSLSADEQTALFNAVQHIVRKCAHFTEYMLLGLALRFCLESWFGQRLKAGVLLLYSMGGGALYACTDEMHQLLIDGRSGQWTDVLIDLCGAAAGAVIGTLILRRTRKEHRG